MAEFRTCKLADVCDSIDYGFTASANIAPIGPKFLRITDIVGADFDWASVPYVEGNISSLDQYRLHHGDIVIARTGATTGESRFIQDPPEAVFASYLVRLKVNANADPRYVAYWLKSPAFRDYLHGVLGDKSAQPNASATTMTSAPMQIPFDKSYQSAVASLLGLLDDKIETNRRTNETLEAMALATFKDWFIDFGPTRAKVAGYVPYLAPNIWVLFPDRLDADGRPTGWRQRPIHGVAEFVNGAAYRDMDFSAERDGFPVIKIAELKEGVTATTKFTTTDLGEKYRIDSEDILFSWSGNPDTSIDTFVWVGGSAWLNQHIFRVRENGSASRTMIYFQLKTLKRNFAEIARNKQTTGLGHVTAADMKRLMVCDPPGSVALAFDEIAGPMFQQIVANQLECHTLAATRDLLLPKLMSGEIRVSAAEKMAEAAL